MAEFLQENEPIRLSGGREWVDETKAKSLIEEWRNLNASSNPTAIVLSNKSFDVSAAQAIVEFIESLPYKIDNADISDIIAGRAEEIGFEVLRLVATALGRFDLQSFNVSDNALGPRGIQSCKGVLTGTKLEKLYLCNNGLSAEATEMLADILLEGTKPPLRTFHFFNNMSGNGGAKAISRILSGLSDTLEDVRFSATRAGEEGCAHIARAIATLHKVTKLDLSDNGFQESGAKLLGESLANHCDRLEHLNLRDDALTCEGFDLFLDKLCEAQFPALRHLDVSGNELSSDNIANLCEWLVTNANGVETLLLDDNEFGSEGALHLAAVIPKLPNLKHLSVQTCEIGGRGAYMLARAVAKSAKFERLDINGNQIGSRALEMLSEIMDEHCKLLGEVDDNDEDADEDDFGDDVDDLIEGIAQTKLDEEED